MILFYTLNILHYHFILIFFSFYVYQFLNHFFIFQLILIILLIFYFLYLFMIINYFFVLNIFTYLNDYFLNSLFIFHIFIFMTRIAVIFFDFSFEMINKIVDNYLFHFPMISFQDLAYLINYLYQLL